MREAAADPLPGELEGRRCRSHVDSPFAPGNRGQDIGRRKIGAGLFGAGRATRTRPERPGATQAVNRGPGPGVGYGFAQFGDASASEQIGQASRMTSKAGVQSPPPVTLLILVLRLPERSSPRRTFAVGLTLVRRRSALTALVSLRHPMSGRRELGDPADRPRRRGRDHRSSPAARQEETAGRSGIGCAGGCRGNFRPGRDRPGISTVMIAMAGIST